jgi:endonuclease YncB( thermonuclease family)
MHRQDYNFDVVSYRVIDGDTIEATVDLGFRATFREHFRLARINTPEMNTTEGKAAKVFLETLLSGADSIGVQSAKTEKYGRWLGEFCVYRGHDKISVSDELLKAGHAVQYPRMGPA